MSNHPAGAARRGDPRVHTVVLAGCLPQVQQGKVLEFPAARFVHDRGPWVVLDVRYRQHLTVAYMAEAPHRN